MDDIIALENVGKQFDGTAAVSDLTLGIEKGTIFGLLGPSGSGKTTAIRLMIGVHAPTSGRVTILGRSPTSWSANDREQIGYMPQIAFLYPNLSAIENVNFSASIYGLGWLARRRRIRELLQVVQMWEHRAKLVSQLSGGMRKRLSLAASLVHNPRLVFLDEPTAGIDPILRQDLWDYFRGLSDQGRTLLVTSHYVAEAEYCDRVGVLDKGKLSAIGSPEELRRSALGGDAVDVVMPVVTTDVMRVVHNVPGVRDVQAVSIKSIRVFVDDSGAAVPKLTEALRDHNVRVDAIREYHPTFDEVFARLVEQAA